MIDQESNSADASSQHSTPSGSDQYRQEESIGMEEEGTPSGANDSLTLSASGRVQRIRKKPKRWEDDDLEVDFTGRLQFLKNSNSRKSTGSAVKVCYFKHSHISKMLIGLVQLLTGESHCQQT